MNQQPTLLELLGVSWPLKAPARAVVWAADDATLACVQDEGLLVLADGVWAQGPSLGERPGGGVAVIAAQAPAAEPRPVRAHPGACRALRADRAGGFLSGGDDGRLVHTSTAGSCAQLVLQAGQPVVAVESGANGVRAWASVRQVHRRRAQQQQRVQESIEPPAPVAALAFNPAGDCLAIAHAGGITLWAGDSTTRLLACAGDVTTLAWSADGKHLAGLTAQGVMQGWRSADGQALALPGQSGDLHCLAFGGGGRFVVVGGAARPLAWRIDSNADNEPPVVCGAASKAAVTQLACHPALAVVAAGFGNGAIALSQPGSADVLVVRNAGDGAVSALAWSGDGSRLAFATNGTQDKAFGWVKLPQALFRSP